MTHKTQMSKTCIRNSLVLGAIFWAVIIALCCNGCAKTPPTPWVEIESATVDSIEFVGAGGYGSPNAVRIWKLSNGMSVSMSDWKCESIRVGDVVAKYKRTYYFRAMIKEESCPSYKWDLKTKGTK